MITHNQHNFQGPAEPEQQGFGSGNSVPVSLKPKAEALRIEGLDEPFIEYLNICYESIYKLARMHNLKTEFRYAELDTFSRAMLVEEFQEFGKNVFAFHRQLDALPINLRTEKLDALSTLAKRKSSLCYYTCKYFEANFSETDFSIEKGKAQVGFLHVDFADKAYISSLKNPRLPQTFVDHFFGKKAAIPEARIESLSDLQLDDGQTLHATQIDFLETMRDAGDFISRGGISAEYEGRTASATTPELLVLGIKTRNMLLRALARQLQQNSFIQTSEGKNLEKAITCIARAGELLIRQTTNISAREKLKYQKDIDELTRQVANHLHNKDCPIYMKAIWLLCCKNRMPMIATLG